MYLTLQGAALERFTQMTNWDYYEATRRFQKVPVPPPLPSQWPFNPKFASVGQGGGCACPCCHVDHAALLVSNTVLLRRGPGEIGAATLSFLLRSEPA